jgi:hypothetical protein
MYTSRQCGEETTMMRLTTESRRSLREELARRFNDDELRTLCVDIGLDYPDLSSNSIAGRSREVVLACERRSLLDKLLQACELERPTVPWSGILQYEALQPGTKNSPQGVYSSAHELPPYSSWSTYSSCGGLGSRILIERLPDRRDYSVRLRAFENESVGIEKLIDLLQGRFEFSYKIEHKAPRVPNVFFYAIPLREPSGLKPSYRPYVEVQSDIPDDPRNAFSPFRQRVVPPLGHYADGRWHEGELEFDLRDIALAHHVVFAPRINEGSSYASPGEVSIRNVRIVALGGSL